MIHQKYNNYQQDQQVQLYDTALCNRTFFKKGEKLAQTQNFVYEYKNYNYPMNSLDIQFALKKLICSMLNTFGGTVFLSINDTTTEVMGAKLAFKELDLFKLNIKSFIENDKNDIVFNPPIRMGIDVTMDFLPVMNAEGTNWLPEHWVPILHIKPENPDLVYIFHHPDKVKQTTINEYCFVRLDGNCNEISQIALRNLQIEKSKGVFTIPSKFQKDLKMPVPDSKGVVACKNPSREAPNEQIKERKGYHKEEPDKIEEKHQNHFKNFSADPRQLIQKQFDNNHNKYGNQNISDKQKIGSPAYNRGSGIGNYEKKEEKQIEYQILDPQERGYQDRDINQNQYNFEPTPPPQPVVVNHNIMNNRPDIYGNIRSSAPAPVYHYPPRPVNNPNSGYLVQPIVQAQHLQRKHPDVY